MAYAAADELACQLAACERSHHAVHESEARAQAAAATAESNAAQVSGLLQELDKAIGCGAEKRLTLPL